MLSTILFSLLAVFAAILLSPVMLALVVLAAALVVNLLIFTLGTIWAVGVVLFAVIVFVAETIRGWWHR